MAEDGKSAQEMLKDIRDKLSELEDTQLVNKLDIINMKNELDKMSLTSAPSAETAEKISELAKLAQKSEKLRRLESSMDSIEKLRADLEKSAPADIGALHLEMRSLKKQVSELQSAQAGAAPGAPAPSREISRIKKEVSELRSALSKGGGEAAGMQELSARIDGLERSMSAPAAGRQAGASKKQMLDLASRIERLESAPAGKAAKPSGVAEPLLKDVMKRLEKLESAAGPPAPRQAVPRDIRADIESLKASLQAGKGAPAAGVPARVRSDLAALDARVAKLESGPARAPASQAPKLSADIQAKLKRVEELSADIRSIKAMVASPAAKGRGKAAGKSPPAMPSDLLKRIRAIEASLVKLDMLKPGMKETKAAVLKLERQVARLAQKEPGPSVEEVESMLENVRSSMTEQGKEILDLHEQESKRVEKQAKKIGMIEKKLSEAAFEDKANAGELDEIRAELQVMKATIPAGLPEPEKLRSLLGEFAAIRSRLDDLEKAAGERGSATGGSERLDSLADDIGVLKTKVEGMERTVAGAGLAPEAMEELRGLKGQFPIEEFATMKDRMSELEEKLAKTSKLAAGLKPIELPDMAGQRGGKASPALEKKVEGLEKIIGEGVTPARLRELETRLEEMKSRLPAEIGRGTDAKLDELREQMESKLHELADVKKAIVESSIDELLAQPANLGKLIDKKLLDDVRDLKKAVEKLSGRSAYPDSKLASILKESDDRERELEKLKAKVKDLEETAGRGFEEFETELKAMTSKLGSVHGSVKGMEEAGTAGVMRDLEILKTKAEWLESTVQKFDLKPIYEKIEELETRLSASGRGEGGYAPIVIE
ncbi:MAG: hypothetical protein JXC85_04015 [Candidatus Aenigmarchaeota archaeon]|nr:hypothetical protein [Candidatus Aenigmarchaeota archaeon]